MIISREAISFGLIVFALLTATFFIGIRRRGKREMVAGYTSDTLRKLLGFFTVAGVLCSLSDKLTIIFRPAPLPGLDILFYAFPIVAGGILFFAGAYAIRLGRYKKVDLTRAGRALFFLVVLLLFGIMLFSYNVKVDLNWSKCIPFLFGRVYMGLIPLLLLMEFVLFLSYRITKSEKASVIVTGILCVVLDILFAVKSNGRTFRWIYMVMFLLGMLFIRYEKKITKILREKAYFLLPGALILFGGIIFQEITAALIRIRKEESPFARNIPFEGHMYIHGTYIGPFSFDSVMFFLASLALVTVFVYITMYLKVFDCIYGFISKFMYELCWVSVPVAYCLDLLALNHMRQAYISTNITEKPGVTILHTTLNNVATGSYLRYDQYVLYILMVLVISSAVSLVLYNPFRIIEKMRSEG